jgi:hypothetical protein
MSSSDVKELIPEFFYLDLFLRNRNGFDMGVRQDRVRVDDVLLPPWAKGSARCDYVSFIFGRHYTTTD